MPFYAFLRQNGTHCLLSDTGQGNPYDNQGSCPEIDATEKKAADYPTRRFVGFALLLAWYYNLWFLHDAFIGVQLLDDCVTESWLFALVAAVIGFIAISFALFITSEQFYVPSFFLVLAVVAIFEVLLIMYFGVLGMKGYVPIGIAFGFSGTFIRFGIAAGSTLALIYEANPSFAFVATTPTAIIFVCILSAIIIPLVRQEYNITKLMAPPATESLQEQRIKELAKEFSLSARETEIVMLIARGFTTDNVAKKLVISPYTVNTHIRHVYEKIGIHKRSELIDYINGNGSGESGN